MFDNEEELLKKIRLGEDNFLELKAVVFKGDGQKIAGPAQSDLADEIAAIANTSDGVLVLGVDDKTRDILGIPLERLDIVESRVRDACNDNVSPPVMVRISRIEFPDMLGDVRAVLKVDIPRSLFVHKSPGGYLWRQGSSKREMSPEFLARLFQQRSQARLIRFEEQEVPSTGFPSLDESLWRRFVTPSEESAEVALCKRGLLIKNDQGDLSASVAGILMCTSHPEVYLPGAYIEAVRYRGVEQDSNYQIDAQRICGPLDLQIEDALKFVRRNQRVSAVKVPDRREIPQFSKRAIFEAVVNAVAHRDYSIYGSKIRLFMFDDRLELHSPGALPNTLTIESIELRQSTRNELISGLLTELPTIESNSVGRKSYMEKRGDGVRIIFRESEKLSGKRPVYLLIDDAELRLTIFSAQANEPENESAREELRQNLD
jgi:predicted HTH transcriptional regulator